MKTIIHWAITIVALALAGFSSYRANALKAEIAARPKVAVMNWHEIFMAQAKDGASHDDAARKTNEIAERLVAAGYVVVEEKSVTAYDPAIKVVP